MNDDYLVDWYIRKRWNILRDALNAIKKSIVQSKEKKCEKICTLIK